MSKVRAIRWVTGCLAAAILILLGMFALLQTPFARELICSKLSSILSSTPHMEVRIEGLQGRIPFDFRIDRISLSDEEGSWSVFRDIHVEWSPLGLLRGRLLIEALEAARVEILRMPPKSEKKEDEKGIDPFSLMDDLPFVTVDRLVVSEILVHEGVLHERGVFRLEGGSGGIHPEKGIRGFLRIQRIDPGPATLLKLVIESTDRPHVFDASLEFEESSGGWVSKLLGLEETEALSFVLRGSGPVEAWKGTLQASFGKFGSIESEVDAAFKPAFSVSMEGTSTLGPPIIPPDFGQLIGPEIRFIADVRLQPDRSVLVHRAQLDGKGCRLKLDGELQYPTQELRTNVSLIVDDLNVAQPLLGVPMEGRLTARALVEGSLQAPVAGVSVGATDVKIRDVRIHSLDTDFRLRPLTKREGHGIRIAGYGMADGVAGRLENRLIEESVQWQWRADVRSNRDIFLDFLEIKNRNHRVDLAANFNVSDLGGSVSASVRMADLGDFSELFGIETSGAGVLQVHATGSARTGSATAQVKGTVHLPEGISSVPAAILGPETALSAQIQVYRGEKVAFSQVNVHSAAFRFQGDGILDIPDKAVTGTWRLSLPTLRAFTATLEKPVSGTVEANGWIGGPVANPAFAADVEGTSITWMGKEFQRVLSNVFVRNGSIAPEGAIRLILESDGIRVRGASDFYSRNHSLELSSLTIEAPRTQLAGNLTLDFEQSLVLGNIKGTSDDLSAPAPLWGEPIGGSADVSARFAWGKTHQAVSGYIEGSVLDTPLFKVGSGRVDVRLENPLHAPKGMFDLKLSGFQSPGLELDTVSLHAEDSEDGFRFDMNADGNAYRPFDLTAAGHVTFHENAAELYVKQASGTYAGSPLALLKPVVLRRTGDSFTLEDFLLDVGGGSLTASLTFDPRNALLKADFKEIPLNGIAMAQGSELYASASGLLEIRGPVREPDAHVQLRLDGCQLGDSSQDPHPPFDLAIQADYKSHRMKADVRLSGLSEKPGELSIEVPVQFSLAPFGFSFFEREPIQGHLYTQTTLDRLLTLIPLGERTLAGQLTADLDLDGSLSSPQLHGTLRFENGSMEEFETGTILRDLEVEITAQGRRLEILKARATDGQAGVISATGWMDMDDAGKFPAAVKLSLSDAVLVRRDEVTGAAEGEIELLKSDRALTVKGKLKINRLEINIPDRFSAETAKLEVIDVTKHGLEGPLDKPEEAQEKPVPDFPVALSIDIDSVERAFIRGWGLDSEWKGRLSISGTGHDPTVSGALSLVRGHYDLLGKRFNLINGEVRFSGGSSLSPKIELEAESKITGGTAFVDVSGSLSAPAIKFRSEPSFPEDEIVARLLFGRGMTQITPFQALRLAQALRAFSSGDNRGFDPLAETRDFLGLDELDVRGGEGGVTDSRVGVGKYVTEDIYLDLEKGLADGTGKVSVTMEITPNVTLESEAGPEAGTGISINWKHDY